MFCGRQTSKWSPGVFIPWYSCPRVIPFPEGLSDLLLMSRKWQRWWFVTSSVRLLKTVTSTLLAPFVSFWFFFSLVKQAAMFRAILWKSPGQITEHDSYTTASEKLRLSFQQPLRNKTPSTITWQSFEVGPPPAKLEATTVPVNTFRAALWENLSRKTQISHAWIPGLHKLWDNKIL